MMREKTVVGREETMKRQKFNINGKKANDVYKNRTLKEGGGGNC
jgi:hypothetical protein